MILSSLATRGYRPHRHVGSLGSASNVFPLNTQSFCVSFFLCCGVELFSCSRLAVFVFLFPHYGRVMVWRVVAPYHLKMKSSASCASYGAPEWSVSYPLMLYERSPVRRTVTDVYLSRMVSVAPTGRLSSMSSLLMSTCSPVSSSVKVVSSSA